MNAGIGRTTKKLALSSKKKLTMGTDIIPSTYANPEQAAVSATSVLMFETTPLNSGSASIWGGIKHSGGKPCVAFVLTFQRRQLHVSSPSASGCVAVKKKTVWKIKKDFKAFRDAISSLEIHHTHKKNESGVLRSVKMLPRKVKRRKKEESEDSGSTWVEGCQHFVDGMLQ